jgi:hypothetical protein
MQGQTLTQDVARGIGRVVRAKTYARIVTGKQTLAYANPPAMRCSWTSARPTLRVHRPGCAGAPP